MKRLKNILPYKYLILVFITLIYVYIITDNLIYKTNYTPGFNELEGVITNIEIKEDKTTFILKAKEKVRVTYYGKLDLEIGDIVKVNGNLQIPSSNTIFNLFNYFTYRN